MQSDREARRQLEFEKRVEEIVDRERIKSDAGYAIKLVETIVFGLIGLILITVAGAIVALVVGPQLWGR